MKLMTNFFLFKYSIAKPNSSFKFKEELKKEYLDENELKRINWQKLKLLLEHAYNNVPYYEKLFKKINLHPDDIKEEKDFLKVPILNREDIIENYDLFFSKDIDKNSMKISTTGGSTGTPLKVAMSPKVNREILKWRMLNWWGLEPNTNTASLYRGVPVKGFKKLVLNIVNWPQKVLRFDATNMTKDNILKFIEEMKNEKPSLVHGYVGAVDAIADYILENNIVLPSPTVVWLTAAPVTKVQEDKISRAFNAPVCDQYGCSEQYFIACECPEKKGLHVFSDTVKVEFIDDNNCSIEDGEYGNLVFTNLEEYGFPLIRYKNGDKSKYLTSKCSCGRVLPLMDKVKGRVSDNIELPNKNIMSGEYLTTIFDDFTDDVKQFQIIQKEDYSINIDIVFFKDENIDLIINKTYDEIESRIKGQVHLTIQKVNSIKSEKGKLQFIKSELKKK